MPRHDYECPRCGERLCDVIRTVAEGALTNPPACPDCAQEGVPGVSMAWIPQARWDMKTDGGGDRGFQKFTVHRQVPTKDGMVQVREEVGSLSQIRKIEADSEQRYRNGEGEPIRFRGYAQGRSNMDVGSFGTQGTIGERTYDSGNPPVQKSGRVTVTRHGDVKPNVKVARGGGVTALKGGT